MASEVGELGSLKEVEGLNSHEGLAVIHFWASWSKPCQQMQEAMCDLAKDCPNVKFYKVVHSMLGLGLCSITLSNLEMVKKCFRD